MTTHNLDLTTIRRSLINNQGHSIVDSTICRINAGQNRITTAIVNSSPMDLFYSQPEVLATSIAVAPFWCQNQNASHSYALLEITGPRGAGIHLLPIDRLVALHMLAAQASDGRMSSCLFPQEREMLDDLGSRIMNLHVPDPESQGYALPNEHRHIAQKLEGEYHRLLESSFGSLSHSTAPFCVFTNLHVAFPRRFAGKGRCLCPSTFLAVEIIPAKMESDKNFRVKIVNSELAYDDGLLSGNPCHPGGYGSMVSAHISVKKLYDIIDHLVANHPDTVSFSDHPPFGD